MNRRRLLGTLPVAALGIISGRAQSSGEGYTSLFDGKTLKGWHATSRLPVPPFPGAPEPHVNPEQLKKAAASKGTWIVENGVLIGGQDPPGSGLGAYLMTDRTFGDFELSIDANPDWSVDTGIYIRCTPRAQAFQVLLDHRPVGSIGFIYGNGIGGFNTRAYAFNGVLDDKKRLTGFVQTPIPKQLPTVPTVYTAPWEDFIRAWRPGDWNTMKIRCVGRIPKISTWINGVHMCEFDAATLDAPNYDKDRVAALLGDRGHIALEVHNGDQIRWATGAVCRWKNIRIREL